MKNFINKVNNDPTSAGIVDASDYNSTFTEIKGAVSPFLTLNEGVNDQLVKSMDIASKAMFYTDIGSVNAVSLTRGATTSQIETMVDGMVVMFTPSHTNSGPSTMKIAHLAPKALLFKGVHLVSNAMSNTGKYMAIYHKATDSWDVDVLTTGNQHYTKASVDTLINNAIPVGSIMTRAGNSSPTEPGHLVCNGAAVSKAAFSALYSEIGDLYAGTGASTTHFNIPDFRGYFLRGRGFVSGSQTLRSMGIAGRQQDLIKSHDHARTSDGSQTISKVPPSSGDGPFVHPSSVSTQNGLDYLTQRTGTTGGIETRPKNYAVIYYIKY